MALNSNKHTNLFLLILLTFLSRSLRLYNLCSLLVSKRKINEIDDALMRSLVNELKVRATEFPELQKAVNSDSDTVLSALACTHAVAKACYGNIDGVDLEVGADQDTQTAVVYCTMALIGTKRYLEFARSINFHDTVSNLTKPSR